MNAKEFREFGYAAIDFIADYMENVHERCVNISSIFERNKNMNIKQKVYFKYVRI